MKEEDRTMNKTASQSLRLSEEFQELILQIFLSKKLFFVVNPENTPPPGSTPWAMALLNP